EKFVTLIDDPAPCVQLQLAFTVGECANKDRGDLLAKLALRNVGDRWISAAVLSSPPELAVTLFRQLDGDRRFAQRPEGESFLAELAAIVGARNRAAEVEAVFTGASTDQPRLQILASLAQGLSATGASLSSG